MKVESVVLAVIVLLAIVVCAFHLNPLLNEEKIPFVWLVPPFALFSLLHAAYLLGWKRAGVMFGVASVLSLGSELLGTVSGFPFGDYYYTDVLGPKLFGHVPIVIPLTWFLMMYPAYLIANLISESKPIVEARGWLQIGWLSLLAAVAMTAWDLTLDPYMVTYEKAWVWEQGGNYLGIPFQNYFGWVLTIFVVFVIYRSLERRIERRPLGPTSKWLVLLPLLTYAFMSIGDVLFGEPVEIVLISPFVMGLPFLFALTGLAQWRPEEDTSPAT